jgi:hypothetical protein
LEGINSLVCKSDIWSLAIIFHEIIFLSHLNEVNDLGFENKKITPTREKEFMEKIELIEKDH